MTRCFRHSVGLFVLVVVSLVCPALAAEADPGVQVARSDVWDAILFWVFGGLTLLSALGIALTRSVVRMVVWLFVTLASVAMLYFLLAANFLAAIQLIVYVGGTLVLLVFGVMLTTKSARVRFDAKPAEVVAAGVVCVLLLAALGGLIRRGNWAPEDPVAEGFSMARIGHELLTTYLAPFEVVSVLLLIVMIGAAYLVRQEK